MICCPDPNILIAKKCTVLPIEFVVRGYITGTTSTSMWMNYSAKGMTEYVEESCVTQHHITRGIHPVYTLIAAYAPMCTRLYMYIQPYIHLTHP